MQVTITAIGDIQRAESIATLERAAERASLARIEAHQVTVRNATTPLERLAADLTALEAEQAENVAERTRLASLCAREQAAIDETLNPLQEQCYRLTQNHEFGDRADSVRKRRDALVQQRATAGRPLQDYDRKHEDSARRLAQRIRDCRDTLVRARRQAEFEATSTEDLEKAAKSARFKLHAAHDDVRLAREAAAHYRAKLAEAHNTVDGEADAVHALAELVGEREALQANAFIAGKPVDAGKLAALAKRIAAEEATLERIKQQAAGARAAVGTLEAKIGEQQTNAVEAVERVRQAEAALQEALGRLERRLTEDAEKEHEGRMQAVRERVQSFRAVETESL